MMKSDTVLPSIILPQYKGIVIYYIDACSLNNTQTPLLILVRCVVESFQCGWLVLKATLTSVTVIILCPQINFINVPGTHVHVMYMHMYMYMYMYM